VSWRGAALCGGAADDFDTAKPILDVVGKSVVHVGPHGVGETVIAANQPDVAENAELVAEIRIITARC
jgi:2-hydroxy-3-oxopropionate reductase